MMKSCLITCLSALVAAPWSRQSALNLQISVDEAMKASIKHGDILAILNLKKQQNETLRHIAQCLNNSFGVVMNPSSRIRRNRPEIRLEWIGNRSIKAGIKLKYLGKAFPNIYIHRLFGDFDKVQDWVYISGIYSSIVNQNEGHNIIINQIDALPTVCNHPFGADSQLFPVFTVFNRITRQMDWNNTVDIIDFLTHEFKFIRPDLLKLITGRLILYKRVHKLRKKVWPMLLSVHKDRHELNRTDVESFIFNKDMTKLEKSLNDPKTQKEYKSFFIAMKAAIASVAVDEMKEKLGSLDLQLSFLELDAEVRAFDLMKVYPRIHLDGDVHVLCNNDAHWDYSLLRKRLLVVFPIVPRYREYAAALSASIAKSVFHPDHRTSA